MLFASLRVAFSYCIGWDIGGALSAFNAAFPLEIPMEQRAWSDVGIHLVFCLTIVVSSRQRSYGRLRCENDTKIKERNKKACQITIASKVMFCFRQ